MNRFATVSLILLALAGCARIVDQPAPAVPPLRAETIPLRPATGGPLIWRPGDWQWTGSGYAWTPGAYEPRGTHSDMWLPGHWEGTTGAYRWVPGRWM